MLIMNEEFTVPTFILHMILLLITEKYTDRSGKANGEKSRI